VERESIMGKSDVWILRVLAFLGLLMLAAGALCAVAAVMEVGAYALFAEGGRFHYEGYRPGGIMFAIITLSLLAYAGLALILLPLGYGHIRRLAWSVLIAEALTWTWMVVGLPLSVAAAVLTLMFKPSSSGTLVLAGLAFLLAYPVGPLLLLLFYRRARACAGLKGDVRAAPPLSARGAAALLVCLAAFGLLPALLGSPFPWFGRIVSGPAGLALLLASAAGLCAAASGVLRGRGWGWWGAVALLAALAVSAPLTAARMTVSEMIAALKLVPEEAKLFAYLPFLDVHPVVAAAAPFVLAVVVLLLAQHKGEGYRISDSQ
jgi:hypothetical protein